MIEISVGMIQQAIRGAGQVNPDCFNLIVRGLICAEVERYAGTRYAGWKHLFDLQLQAQARVLRRSPMSQANRTETLINTVLPTTPPYNTWNSQVVSECQFLQRIRVSC